MAKKYKSLHPDEPLKHPDHPRPVTRRDFIRQGFMTGGAMVTGNALLNLFLHPEQAHALATDVATMDTGPNCVVGAGGALKIPFIAFDLGGGANIAGSNVVVGGQGGQTDIGAVGTAGYSRLGIPGDRLPGLADGQGGDFTNNSLGLIFHSESALLAGILDKVSAGCAAGVNGAIIPARSDNDTGNNPHNPMYGIARAGARGSLLSLVGSVASESGARSMSPAAYINPEIRPTKVDRSSDVTGLVDTGELLTILNQADAVRVMEAVARISNAKIGGIDPNLSSGAAETSLRQLLRCGYVKAADVAEQFADPQAINPEADVNIKGANGIFTDAEFDGDGEFRKTASVMKLVINTLAGAGSITMGGYDYHTGDRTTGERRDIRAGRCIGACLEYAHRRGIPLMVYVYSDGSVFSNGTPDPNGVTDGSITLQGGKGVWTGDNSTTAASIILVYHPDPGFTFNPSSPLITPPAGIRTAVRGTGQAQLRRQQLGYFRNNGAMETSPRTPGGNLITAASNVERLVDTVLLNYMALHYNTQSAGIGQLLTDFKATFPNHGLGSDAALDELIIFNGVVNGQITSKL